MRGISFTQAVRAAFLIKKNKVRLISESNRFVFFEVDSIGNTYDVTFHKDRDLWTCTCFFSSNYGVNKSDCVHIKVCYKLYQDKCEAKDG